MNKPPSEGFDYGWKMPALPCMLEDLVSLGYAPRALLRELNGVLSREVPVDILSGADEECSSKRRMLC
jgi:hypothetical protein